MYHLSQASWYLEQSHEDSSLYLWVRQEENSFQISRRNNGCTMASLCYKHEGTVVLEFPALITMRNGVRTKQLCLSMEQALQEHLVYRDLSKCITT